MFQMGNGVVLGDFTSYGSFVYILIHIVLGVLAFILLTIMRDGSAHEMICNSK